MTQPAEILFSLLRYALGKEGCKPSGTSVFADCKAIDWEAVYKLAARQGVCALAWDALQKLIEEGVVPADIQMSRALKIQWSYTVLQIEESYKRQRQVIEKLALFYDTHQIKMMILKGYGLSLLYPAPNHRPCSDIDIWLYGKQKVADELLLREKKIAIQKDKHHHTVFFIDGVMVENHYDFINIHAHLSSRAVERQLQEFAKQPDEEIAVGETRIFLPPPNFNALFLLRHAASHFAAAHIALRHVVDWALFIERYHKQIDFEALESIAREYNMDRFLHCLYAVAIDNLGLPAEYIPPFERDAELEQRVLNDILYPEFIDETPSGNLLKILRFKYHRWWANRWKHRIVYRENLFITFVVQVWSHLLKPKSFKS